MTMAELFRLKGATKKAPAVEAWFRARPGELGDLAHEWFTAIRECGPDVLELVHDGCPVACVGDAAFAYVNAFRSHVNVGFFQGAVLSDPAGLLEGTGRNMRHVKLRAGVSVNAEALEALIREAYRDIRERS